MIYRAFQNHGEQNLLKAKIQGVEYLTGMSFKSTDKDVKKYRKPHQDLKWIELYVPVSDSKDFPFHLHQSGKLTDINKA